MNEFLPNENGWHMLASSAGQHNYRVATNDQGKIIIERDTGETMVITQDKWFYRKGLIDDFWEKNF